MPGESKEKADLVLHILRYDMNECICDCYSDYATGGLRDYEIQLL
jgi:hypothetical protein